MRLNGHGPIQMVIVPKTEATTATKQLLWENPEAFPGQSKDFVTLECPGSSSRSHTGWTCSEHLTRETSRRQLKQMPEQPQVVLLDVKEQWPNSEFLSCD
ncbi:hypothetical protein WMY93_015182 [Mugilogobius chulae]|uniref:Uncharacterized protein n=1 Tax=Mugilogobius chulae TaxID=88201 RepID=A0AAW0P6F3_9GOBI